MSFDDLLARKPLSIPQDEKEEILVADLRILTEHHRRHCLPYAAILDAFDRPEIKRLVDVPYLPVSLFKTHRLASIPEDQVFKTMTSSATTGQLVSKIVIDRETADRQAKTLTHVMTQVLGQHRLPMIVIDSPNVVKDRKMFSARGAGVLGMIQYGRQHFYCLNDDMELDTSALKAWLAKHTGEPLLLFGFTFMVWKYFLQQVKDEGLDLSKGTLIHSGGWKKLQDEAVGNTEFKSIFRESTGLTHIHSFYGMVEQVGSVFLEGSDGFLYPPNVADVIIRNPFTWEEAALGEPGVIQVLSILPTSYPGHSILTEDLGIVHGIGDPSSGCAGKQLEVLGRVPRTDLRGCSDTHAAQVELEARAAFAGASR